MPEPVGFRRMDLARQPRYDLPSYGSTHRRHPKRGFVRVPHTLSEISAPCMAPAWYAPHEHLPKIDGKAALGERIIVAGRVLDEDGRSVRGAMAEVWQANAAGRYHQPARSARCTARSELPRPVGACSRTKPAMTASRPSARCLSVRNHASAWRTGAHPLLARRRWSRAAADHPDVRPGDPLLALDPSFQSTVDETARDRLIARQDSGTAGMSGEWRLDIRLQGETVFLEV